MRRGAATSPDVDAFDLQSRISKLIQPGVTHIQTCALEKLSIEATEARFTMDSSGLVCMTSSPSSSIIVGS